MLMYPHINPIALKLGPLKIHWYGLMYLLSFLLGWVLLNYRVKKYPINKIPGIIRIIAGKNDTGRIKKCLEDFIAFFTSHFHFPKYFIGDSKFQVSYNRVIMEGKDGRSRKIKRMEIGPKTTNVDIAREFNWPVK